MIAARLIAITIAMAPILVSATAVLSEIEQRLSQDGPDQVNADFQTTGSTALAELHRRVADCELQAVSLAIRLSRSSVAKVTQAHVDAVRVAVGRCPRFVVAMAGRGEVSRYCASLDSWSPAQTARELRRRIASIESDAVLRSTESGKSCQAAYEYELKNTRVVLRKRE